jgi:serine/threonine protein kinase
LAEHKIVHRDLKLENILLNFNNFENYHAAIAKGG